MAASDPQKDISEYVMQKLSQTPYTCSSLSPPFGSRLANFVYRGNLTQPLSTATSTSVKSIIIKYSTDPDPRIFEELLLKSLASHPLSTTVKTPLLYIYNHDANIQVFEDFVITMDFRAMMFSPDSYKLLPQPSPAVIGHHVGQWLRSFHSWSSAPEQAGLRAQVWRTDPTRKIKYHFTYGIFPIVLSKYPELLIGYEKTLEAFQSFIAAEFEVSSSKEGENYGILHGDFWSGNFLLPSSGWQISPLNIESNQIVIIDWEFAQFGHRSTDLGQIVGDLYERYVYRKLGNALSIIEGVIEGYGQLSDEMAFRTAIYIGVHLISWHERRPRAGPNVASPESILAGLTLGRNFVVNGWRRERAFFETSALASLFKSR